VLAGTFECGTRSKKALLYPGSFLLGNAGSHFECGHDHGGGDHCVAFHFDTALFEEIASSAAGSARFRFASPRLPSSANFAWAAVESALTAEGKGCTAAEELAISLADRVLRALSGHNEGPLRPLPRERRRLLRALHYIAEHSEEPLTLDNLSSVACMSKFHFLSHLQAKCLQGVSRFIGRVPE